MVLDRAMQFSRIKRLKLSQAQNAKKARTSNKGPEN
jgi:hypothetical protein